MTFKQFRVAGVTASGFVLPAAVLLERKPNHAQKAIAAAKVRVDEEQVRSRSAAEQSIESDTAAIIQRSILFLQRQW